MTPPSSLLVVGWTISALMHITNNQIIACSGSCSCPSTASGPCTLNCEGTDKCKDSRLTCREGDACYINCIGYSSCGGEARLDGTGATNVEITCDGTDACKGNTIIRCGTANCSVTCDGSTSCESARVYAPDARQFECTGSCSPTQSVPSPFIRTTTAPTVAPTPEPTSDTKSPTMTMTTPLIAEDESSRSTTETITEYDVNDPDDIDNGWNDVNSTQSESSNDNALIVINVIVSILGCYLIVYGLWLLYRKKKQREQEEREKKQRKQKKKKKKKKRKDEEKADGENAEKLIFIRADGHEQDGEQGYISPHDSDEDVEVATKQSNPIQEEEEEKHEDVSRVRTALPPRPNKPPPPPPKKEDKKDGVSAAQNAASTDSPSIEVLRVTPDVLEEEEEEDKVFLDEQSKHNEHEQIRPDAERRNETGYNAIDALINAAVDGNQDEDNK